MATDTRKDTTIRAVQSQFVLYSGSGKDRSSLVFGVSAGYPRFTAYKSTEATGKDNMIIAPLCYQAAYAVLLTIDGLASANTPVGTSREVKCYNTYKNGDKQGEKYLQATLTFGKNQEGVLYIAIANEQDKLTFLYSGLGNGYITFSGVKDKSAASALDAKTWCEAARAVLTAVIGDAIKTTVLPANTDATKPTKPKADVPNTAANSGTDITYKEEELF